MKNNKTLSGVLAPVVTPYQSDLAPDATRLIRLCRWLLSQSCGLALFGTNSEGNSLSVDERIRLLDALVEAGIDTGRMMPGTGACAIPDAVRLTAHAVKLGCAGVLMLPPFYYKEPSDEGLFRSFSETIERVGSADLRIYLYHFPQVAQVGIPIALIARLVKAYPQTVVGMKDSSNDWTNMATILKEFPGFSLFGGNETMLLKSMQAGAAGCISATANINPASIHELYVDWRAANASAKQKALNDLRSFMQEFPMIPALKHVVAHFAGDEAWSRVRPPLIELDATQSARLIDGLERRRFAMPGWMKTA